MARFRQRDIAGFSRGLALLNADVSVETLSTRVLGCLHSLFDCDFVSYSSVDLRNVQLHAFTITPNVTDWPGMHVYQQYLHADPGAQHFIKTRDPSVIRISDLISLRRYRASSVYTEVFHRTGCDRRLGFAMQNVGPISLASTLNRRKKDFSDEDKALFDLMRPHLLQASRHAHAHQLVQAEHARHREDLGAVFGRGLGAVDATGRIRWFTAHARELLAEFFPAGPHGDMLPEELHRHLLGTLQQPVLPTLAFAQAPGRFVWQFKGAGERLLKVRLVATATPGHWQMLLEAIDDAASIRRLSQVLNLTLREAEALHWLKQGKTNWEIGMVLHITEKTVGKHFEHIFAKLGVENRTAAVRLALEASLGA